MLIIIIWSNLFLSSPQKVEQTADTTAVAPEIEVEPDTTAKTVAETRQISHAETAMAAVSQEPEKTVVVETRRAVYTLSSRGGNLTQVLLKNYVKYDSTQVSLISAPDSSDWSAYGALTLGYSDSLPAFNVLNFKVDSEDIRLDEADSVGSVTFTYYDENGASIVKKYTFHDNEFVFDLEIDLEKPQELGMGQGVTVGWFAPLMSTERDIKQDKGKLGGFFSMGGDFDYFNDLKDGKLNKTVTGPVDWVATRTKYFTAVIIADTSPAQEVIVVGSDMALVDSTGESHPWTRFGAGMTYDRPPDSLSLDFTVYTGPLDYDRLKKMGKGLSSLVDMGWKVFRPFAIAILWLFTSFHKIIPNYGFVIIVFSILMKLVFWPLSIKSAKSMHRMKEMQPRIQEIKEKFKDEPARIQQETMKVYKEFGVNPFSSCLPMLVQLPIFWALYSVLSNTIELRGADFIFWITDLSQPDPSGRFIPLGIGILPIIMGISMFIQQKITITDPKQKAMVYFMPILFTFLFSRWASGLVLYWTMFNIMGIFEQLFVKRNIRNEKAT